MKSRVSKSSKILIVVLLIACVAVTRYKAIAAALNVRSRQDLKDAVLRAAFQCYAVEGVYPQSAEYLEEHYGLMVNHNKYIVSYECRASNRMPQVMIIEKK